MKTITKHGKRSADSALLSVVMSKSDKAALKIIAKQDGRTASNFAARELAKIVAAHSAKPEPQSHEAEAIDLGKIRLALKARLNAPSFKK